MKKTAYKRLKREYGGFTAFGACYMEIKKILQQNFNKFIKQTKKMPVAHKCIIFGFVTFICIVSLITLVVICIGLSKGFAKINDLHVLLTDITSPSAVAVVLLAGRWFVDSDGNGTADVLEQKDEKPKRFDKVV